MTTIAHGTAEVSGWVNRWSHLVPAHGTVLDIACGHGRHMAWFARHGHAVTGVDRSPEAIEAVRHLGEAILADIENAPWPLIQGTPGTPRKDGTSGTGAGMEAGVTLRRFDAVVVTNYLWRPLFATICQSLAPGGVLIYETFATGNETVGKPSRPDFLLKSGELLRAFSQLRVVAFEEGFLEAPARFVQRLAGVREASGNDPAHMPMAYASSQPKRYPLRQATHEQPVNNP